MPANAGAVAEPYSAILVSQAARLKLSFLNPNLNRQFYVDENRYHLAVQKPLVFNAALGFCIGGGLFLLLLALSYSAMGALLGSMQLSFALTLVVGFSLLLNDRNVSTGNIV